MVECTRQTLVPLEPPEALDLSLSIDAQRRVDGRVGRARRRRGDPRGPFKSFWHEHTFEPAEGGTMLRDDIRFEAPLGPLGTIAERLVLRRYVPHLIDVRNEFLVSEARRRSE